MENTDARKNTNKLLDYIEEVCGREPTEVEIALVKWMGDDEVGECARANEFILEYEEEDEDNFDLEI